MPHRLCPFWVGYLLASPIRKLGHNPDRILGPYVRPGMRCVDLGCAMGFFSLPMARMAGPDGRVVCVDLRSGMIDGLLRRARRVGLADWMEGRICTADSLGIADLAGRVDFALAFAVIHETPDPARFVREAADVLKPGSRLLVAEPKGHVPAAEFVQTVAFATGAGLRAIAAPPIWGARATVLERSG